MKVIQVQAPGPFTTVQDLGREGFGPLGISPSGAADPISLRLGNRLVGNAEGAAALEMTLLGGAFCFRKAPSWPSQAPILVRHWMVRPSSCGPRLKQARAKHFAWGPRDPERAAICAFTVELL